MSDRPDTPAPAGSPRQGWRTVLYGLLIAALVAAVVHPLRRYVVEPRRQALLGRVESPGRQLAMASQFGFDTAAGSSVRMVPGASTQSLEDLPAESATVILGGFRGPYVVWLWMKAEEEKDRKIHFDLMQRYTAIAAIQSDYPQVWTYLAWNMAYNLSAQWQSPEHKYQWIRRAVDFLEEGYRRNPHSADIAGEIGRIYDHKFGRSQEAPFYRRWVLDEEGRSVFLIAYEWYDRARKANDLYGTLSKTGLSKPAFYEQACHCVTNYATELTQDSYDAFKAGLDARAAGREDEARRQFDLGAKRLADAIGAWQWAVREWKEQFTRFEREGVSPMLDSVFHLFHDEAQDNVQKLELLQGELTYDNLAEKFKTMTRPPEIS